MPISSVKTHSAKGRQLSPAVTHQFLIDCSQRDLMPLARRLHERLVPVGASGDTSTMFVDNFALVDEALRSSWDRRTCDPVDLPEWRSDNPARGQCGVTALVIQDLMGGELVVCDVLHADGTRQGVHYWNRVGQLDIDLTRQQFVDGEQIGPGRVVARPAGGPRRCFEQYAALCARVMIHLERHG